MEPRLSLLTIGVADLPRARAFYEDVFGWTPVTANADIVFFRLNGFLLALFGDEALARDAAARHESQAFRGFTLAHDVRTEAEVDALFARLAARGVTIAKPPERTFFGAYAGYVADPEGIRWEIACNPWVELAPNGDAVSHRDLALLGTP